MKDMVKISNLNQTFYTKDGELEVLKNINFNLMEGQILTILGPSGSGKSTILNILTKLLKPTSGDVIINGKIGYMFQKDNLLEWRNIMDNITIGLEIQKKKTDEAMERVERLLKTYDLWDFRNMYPKELSGGMRQRIIIAIALSCNPKLIIADEPTTALDVTVQSQILELLQQIAEETGTAIIMITHDLGVVATLCQKINIMYGGQIVEHGTTDEIFYNPKHPYTMGLLRSIGTHTNGERQSLIPIPGTPPDLLKLNSGCAFMPRCSKAMKICKDYMPCRTQFSEDQYCSCWEYCKDSADKIVQEQSAAVNG